MSATTVLAPSIDNVPSEEGMKGKVAVVAGSTSG